MKAAPDNRRKKIRLFFDRLSFDHKLFLLLLIPIVLLALFTGLLSHSVFRNNLIDLTEKNLEGRADMISDNIDSLLGTILKKVDILSFDSRINKLLYDSLTFPSDKTGVVYNIRNRIVEVLNIEMIHGITFEIYTTNRRLVEDYYIYDYETLEETLSEEERNLLSRGHIVWLPPIEATPGSLIEKKTIRFALQPNRAMEDGLFILVVKIPEDMIIDELRSMESITEEGWSCLTDATGNILSSWNLDAENSGVVSQIAALYEVEGVSVNLNDSMILVKRLYIGSGRDTLNLILSIPYRNVTAGVDHVILAFVLIIFALILIILPVTYYLLRNVTGRLYRFIGSLEAMDMDSMEEVRINPILDDRKDDISRIIRKFNQIIIRMNRLLKDKYTTKLEMERIEKDLLRAKYDRNTMELSLLQAQIDPHFLYNIFSSIKNSLNNCNAGDVEDIFDSLVRFYRLTLNNGKDVLRVSQELELTKEYIGIQNFIHNGKFMVIQEFDEEVNDCGCIKLLLQPIVENALIHGFRNKDHDCILVITARRSDDCIHFDISDNGAGMEQEKLKEILDRNSKTGYGIRNTMDRIRLFFGEKGNVEIRSVPGEGTDVRITIPVIPYNLIGQFNREDR